MLDKLMNDDLRDFQDVTRKWIENEITPHHEKWCDEGIIPREIYQKAGEQGFLCITQDEKYGGLGLDFRFSTIVTEEIARAGAGGLLFCLHSDIVAPYISHYGSEEQKMKYLPKMASGETIGAIAMTEPGAGSDLQAISTKATLEGDHWVLNGQKTFVSNGICSDLIIVCASTEPKEGQKFAPISLFLVEEGTPGFERGRNLKKIGLKSQDTAELYFNNCKIPKENLLGEAGQGFKYLVKQLGQERLCIAIWCTTQARAVLDYTIRYCNEREVFGKKVSNFQNTRFKCAEMDTEISLAETFVDHCIEDLVAGKDITVNASKAKYWCSELFGRVTDECLQLHGGYGYMREYDVANAYVDARIQRIFGGTTEIMKEIIARQLF